MNNVLLVHGSYGKPFENWFPWLEGELSGRGIRCAIPSFPTPEHQRYGDWSRLLDYYVDMGVVDGDSILIGHSCGSVFLARYLSEHKNLAVKALVTVSGYNGFVSGDEGMDSLNGDFYAPEESFGFESRVRQVHSFYSDNDPFIPQEYLRSFPKLIGAEEHVVSGAGHFNSASGYDAFPQILECIL